MTKVRHDAHYSHLTSGLVANHQFYLGTKDFVAAHRQAIDITVAEIGKLDAWANGNTDAVADQLAASVGIPAPVLKIALERQTFGVTAISEEVIAQQQKIADTFHRLGLIPKPISIAEAVPKTT